MLKRFCILFIIIVSLLGCNNKKATGAGMRIVVASPEVAEIIYSLDGISHIVGISNECTSPKELQNLPKIGGFGSINKERILALNPSIVFTAGHEQKQLAIDLGKLGIKTVLIESNSFSEFIENIKKIGNEIGQNEKATKIIDKIQCELASLKTIENKPSVYIEIYSDPIMTVNNDSFVADLVSLAGGKNLYSDLPRPYSRINQESVIEKNPDIIITTYPTSPKEIYKRKGWSNVAAIKNSII